jgi:pSer/pThr/pTyr-binding forkhead associated (FHA) protein
VCVLQVLQFNGSSKAVHVFDNASTHGTYVNKQRIKPHVHVPIRCVQVRLYPKNVRALNLRS